MNLGEGVEFDKDAGFFLGQDRYIIYSYEHDGLWQDTPEDVHWQNHSATQLPVPIQ